MKNSSLLLLMIMILLSSCIKKPEKTGQNVSAGSRTSIEKSDVTYTAAVVKGNVTWSSNDSLWNRVENKMVLLYGCFVETGKKSATMLLGSLDDVVQMSEQAKVQLTIEELRKQGERSSLALRGIRLLRGKAKFDVKSGGKFIVETPTVRVDVKGTVFIVDVDSTGKTDVAVIEGVVNVVPLKDTSHVNELLPGKVLRDAGNPDSWIDSCTTEDTTMISQQTGSPSTIQLPGEKISTGSSGGNTVDDNDEARNRLTPTPGYHGKATQRAATEAAEKLNREEQVTSQKIEAEKAAYYQKKDSIVNAHAIIKAAEERKPDLAREEAQDKLDNERAISESKLDAERAKTEAKFTEEQNISGDKTDAARTKAEKRLQKERSSAKQPQGRLGATGADDSFDELERRKGN